MKKRKAILIGLGLAALYWILESAAMVFIFNEGFLYQLIDLWERVKGEKENYMTGSAGGNQGASV